MEPSLSAATPKQSGSQPITTPRTNKRVVIIGAGFSGLSVAYHLLEHQRIQNDVSWQIQIAEARDRIGGRVHPLVWDESTVVDLGGQWVHEASERNPFVPLFRNVLKIPLLYKQLEEQEKKDNENKPPPPRRAAAQLYDRTTGQPISKSVYQSALRFYYKALRSHKNTKITSATCLQDFMDAAWQGRRDDTDFEKVVQYLVHRHECYEGGRFRELSVAMEHVYDNLGGPDEYPVGGYHAVLKALMENMDMSIVPEPKKGTTTTHGETTVTTKDTTTSNDKNNCIQLNTIVDTISYNKQNNHADAVTLTCRDGSHITADYCVCTLPLGVLQQRKVSFDPPLSPARWKAIDSIGMGVLDKVILQFNDKFWSGDDFGTCDTNIRSVQHFVDCSTDFGSPVLVMFVGGDAARRFDDLEDNNKNDIETARPPLLTDEQIVEEALASLRCIFGADTVGTPLRTHVTRWLADPFACGAYSFCQTGSNENSYRTVAQPCGNDTLFFAGEHTSLQMHACVHGAWETGKREAERIIQLACGGKNEKGKKKTRRKQAVSSN